MTTKRNKKRLKKAIYFSSKIMDAVIDSSLSFAEATMSVDLVYKGTRNIFGLPSGLTSSRGIITRKLQNLKKSAKIEILEDKNGNRSIVLTNKAKIQNIDRFANKAVKDAKLRLLSFDIPEDERYRRDSFRRTIKAIGFKELQKSLWVIDKNVTELVEFAIKEHDVADFVIYVVVESTNVDQMIYNKFIKHKKPTKKENNGIWNLFDLSEIETKGKKNRW